MRKMIHDDGGRCGRRRFVSARRRCRRPRFRLAARRYRSGPAAPHGSGAPTTSTPRARTGRATGHRRGRRRAGPACSSSIFTDHGDGDRRTGSARVHPRRARASTASRSAPTAGTTSRSACRRRHIRSAARRRRSSRTSRAWAGSASPRTPIIPEPELAWTDWRAPIDGIEWLNADSEWRDEGSAGPGARRVRLLAAARRRDSRRCSTARSRRSTRWDACERGTADRRPGGGGRSRRRDGEDREWRGSRVRRSALGTRPASGPSRTA